MTQVKEEKKSVHPLSASVLCFFVFYLSPMNFHTFHTFSTHNAQSAQMSVLCVDKSGSEAFQIHFKRLSSTALSLYEVKSSSV